MLNKIAAQIVAGPKHRWPDLPATFSVAAAVWRQLCLTINLNHNALVIGPTGSGKSQLVEWAARSMNRPWFSFNFGGVLDPRGELLGATQLREARTEFCDARFLQAIQTPDAVVVLDEINRCEGMFLNLLTPVLDGHRFLTISERHHDPVVHVAEGVTFFGIANIGPEYAHTVPLDRAIMDRFHSTIHLDYVNPDEEVRLILQRNRFLDRGLAEELARLAYHQRSKARRGEFGIYVSTRMVLAAAEMANYGIELGQAIEFAMTNKFSDSGEANDSERFRFRLLTQKLLWK